MSILYFDCISGISGDMVVGALVDAGADPVEMEKALEKLGIANEYELKWSKVVKNGITATKFDVLLRQDADHEHNHTHGHGHSHEQSHTHEHSHSHHHHHGQRTYKDIVLMIDGAGFDDHVRSMALNIFRKIGEAEAVIHGTSLENVHFHEVGAVDSIVDIVGTCLLIDQLGVSSIQCSPIPVGSGKISIDHGIYPVPAPATLEILKGIPILGGGIAGELATPTGAAIAAVLSKGFSEIPKIKVKEIGYGAGTKSFKDHPNVLRVIIGE